MAKAAGLERKARLEVVECWDMLQIWSDWFAETFGLITGVRHRSHRDDPPDLEIVFQDGIVAMEHTKLQPPHLGQAEALSRKMQSGGFVPSSSSPS